MEQIPPEIWYHICINFPIEIYPLLTTSRGIRRTILQYSPILRDTWFYLRNGEGVIPDGYNIRRLSLLTHTGNHLMYQMAENIIKLDISQYNRWLTIPRGMSYSHSDMMRHVDIIQDVLDTEDATRPEISRAFARLHALYITADLYRFYSYIKKLNVKLIILK